MNDQDVANALLLRESGELSAEETAELESYLREHPESTVLADEYQLLQEAGRFASQQMVPPLNDLGKERIRSLASTSSSAWRPRVLAIAAALVVFFFALPILTPPAPSTAPSPEMVQQDPSPLPEAIPADDLEWMEQDVWQEVADLEAELSAWQSLSLDDPWLVEDEASWAAELLTVGDSI